MEFKPKIKEFHFWNLKDNYCLKMKDKFMGKILSKCLHFNMPFYEIANQIGVGESILRDIKNNPSKKIEIKTLFKILKFLKRNGIRFNLNDLETNINWMGNSFGRGITKPRLPFRIESPKFTALLSSSFGDGTITNISFNSSTKYRLGVFEYSNEEEILRKRLIKSSMKALGGKPTDYVERANRNSFSIFFPSIIRDILLLGGGQRGEKSTHNPHIPSVVMNSPDKKIWIKWLQQTVDDEGSVRYRENSNHEVYITRVVDITEDFLKQLNPGTKKSFGKFSKKEKEVILKVPSNLLVDELELFKRLRIDGKLRPQEIYVTKKGEIKAKWRLYITRKNNIRKFARIIGFRIPRKQIILRKI